MTETPTNNIASNLAFLCLEHHDEYDTRHSQSKGLTSQEVRSYRSELYQTVEALLAHLPEIGDAMHVISELAESQREQNANIAERLDCLQEEIRDVLDGVRRQLH